ncbi:uncharacterized protein LOC132193389 [Neocloeon triangulifer]|uniref:uncharacterized protein LOC132193389 n=1 Tax=Neocloeon triangulifer TaxID=2078957 RepID=UPI00286F112B|nr:uncharacterized protein LOC132193389 [Neocloeon triangulifer]XP_059470012.1 uncharacterized protein LOC132193389 [Neocloeon triangulifer]
MIYCIACGCRYQVGCQKKFHLLPRLQSIQEKWKDFIRLAWGSAWEEPRIWGRRHVCADHFDKTDYSVDKIGYLKENAVPHIMKAENDLSTIRIRRKSKDTSPKQRVPTKPKLTEKPAGPDYMSITEGEMQTEPVEFPAMINDLDSPLQKNILVAAMDSFKKKIEYLEMASKQPLTKSECTTLEQLKKNVRDLNERLQQWALGMMTEEVVFPEKHTQVSEFVQAEYLLLKAEGKLAKIQVQNREAKLKTMREEIKDAEKRAEEAERKLAEMILAEQKQIDGSDIKELRGKVKEAERKVHSVQQQNEKLRLKLDEMSKIYKAKQAEPGVAELRAANEKLEFQLSLAHNTSEELKFQLTLAEVQSSAKIKVLNLKLNAANKELANRYKIIQKERKKQQQMEIPRRIRTSKVVKTKVESKQIRRFASKIVLPFGCVNPNAPLVPMDVNGETLEPSVVIMLPIKSEDNL